MREELVLEGIVTTVDAEGAVNVAPMGPRVDAKFQRLTLRPFKTAQTYRNLKAHGEGVFHVTDDVLLIARAAVGEVEPALILLPATEIRGHVIQGVCRFYEFRVLDIDDRQERAEITVGVVRTGRVRDFFGFNRAKHAVLEAAILATRLHLLPRAEILAEFAKLGVIVDKTGGRQERQAFAFLQEFVTAAAENPGPPAPEGGGGETKPGDGNGVLHLEFGGPPSPLRGGGGGAEVLATVRTGSRLHFGLLAPAGAEGRQFGGVGLMIDQPGLEVSARPARAWKIEGPLADRAVAVIRTLQERPGLVLEPPLALRLGRGAQEHQGLGTGTQLSLAVARLLAEVYGWPAKAAPALAELVGRGARSGVGVHGFDLGGLLVDGGKRAAEGVAPLIARHAFPEPWRVVLLIPPGGSGVHGQAERAAFAGLAPDPDRTAALCRLLLLGLLPAVAEADYPAFAEALHAYNRQAGELFAAAQGGPYGSTRVADAVAAIRELGVPGAGQSSWGPTVFAVTADPDQATWLAEQVRRRPDLLPAQVLITTARNQGAAVERPEAAVGPRPATA